MTLPAGKPRTVDSIFCNLYHRSLLSEQFTGDYKGANGVTSGVNIYQYLQHLIKPHNVY